MVENILDPAPSGPNQQFAQSGQPLAYGQENRQSGAASTYGQQFLPPNPVPADGQQPTAPGMNSSFGQQGPIIPAAFDQPVAQDQNSGGGIGGNPKYSLSRQQDNRQSELIAPNPNPSYDLRSAGDSGTPVVPAYSNSAPTMSRSNQMPATGSYDPQWHEAERLERLGDIDLAIRLYDIVGQSNGIKDPNLAIRAMNRAQYLRNAIQRRSIATEWRVPKRQDQLYGSRLP